MARPAPDPSPSRLEPATRARRLVLTAVDRRPCGTETTRRFAVEWRLNGSGTRLRASELSAVKLAGLDPAAAC